MIVVLPFCSKDLLAARELLEWINQLGGCPAHHLVLVVEEGLQWSDVTEMMQLGSSFQTVKLLVSPPVAGWPAGPNMMFRTAATHLRDEVFFWMEPDCTPLCPHWLDRIVDAYAACNKPFMGAVMEAGGNPNIPHRSLNGNAVYPAHAIDVIGPTLQDNSAWEMTSAALVMPQAADTLLIQHFWGEPDLSPTFVKNRSKRSPRNAFTLENLRAEAVIFHRNKDGTLIRLLREKLYGGYGNNSLKVVLPFCNHDAHLMTKLLEFIGWLSGPQPFEAFISYDHSTDNAKASRIQQLASQAFAAVHQIRYPVPLHSSWPYAANCAFQYAADHMAQTTGPWLWLEADATPLTPEWLPTLDHEYRRQRKLFFGPIVEGRGHMNGVAIYPPETPSIAPRAMESQWGAWDTDMKIDMIHLCHDASDLIQHCWGVVNGKLHPYEGDPPSFGNRESLGWLLTSAVLFHRCKDGSLIDRLKEL